MTDVSREKFVRLMADIEVLEGRIEDLSAELKDGDATSDPADKDFVQETLVSLQEKLAEGRSELARISDGCGRPHPQ